MNELPEENSAPAEQQVHFFTVNVTSESELIFSFCHLLLHIQFYENTSVNTAAIQPCSWPSKHWKFKESKCFLPIMLSAAWDQQCLQPDVNLAGTKSETATALIRLQKQYDITGGTRYEDVELNQTTNQIVFVRFQELVEQSSRHLLEFLLQSGYITATQSDNVTEAITVSRYHL